MFMVRKRKALSVNTPGMVIQKKILSKNFFLLDSQLISVGTLMVSGETKHGGLE